MTLALPSSDMGLAPVQGAYGYSGGRYGYGAGLYPEAGEEAQHARRLLVPDTLPLQTDFRSTNVIFWGRRGKGKTLSMVGISKLLAPGFQQAGWHVQANIPIDFSDIGVKVNCHPLLGSFIAKDMDKAERSLIDFDELTEIVPSRKAMTKSNYNSLSVMVQIRKLMCEVMTTTQFPTSIDNQMLQQLDLYVLCDAHVPRDARWNKASAYRAYIKLFVFDLWGQFTGQVMRTRVFPPPLQFAMKVMYLYNLPGAWKCYNSWNRVISEHASDETKEAMMSRHWDMTEVMRMEEEADTKLQKAREQNPAEKEYDEAVEARYAEEAAHPHAPPPISKHSCEPTTFEEWIASKREANTFGINQAVIKDAQRFMPKIENHTDLVKALEARGFDVDRKNRRCTAHWKGK